MTPAMPRARGLEVAGALGLVLGATGCFASWSAVQLSGSARLLEEGAREASVPQPGVQEVLRVQLPLASGASAASGATASSAGAAADATPRALELACEATQHGSDRVDRSAFRYGKTWRSATAVMFFLEAAAAVAFFYGDREDPRSQLAAGVLAVDALGTAALFFAPRKEIYRTELRPSAIHVRSDCPDGLALDIGGEAYPVDAAGRLGELGEAALDEWMQAPGAPLRITYAGRTAVLPIGRPEQCAWNESHHPQGAASTSQGAAATSQAAASPSQAAASASPGAAAPASSAAQPSICPGYGVPPPRHVFAQIEVPLGTLTRVDAATAP